MYDFIIIGLIGNSLFYNIDRYPNVGETIKASSLYQELGGKGYNQALYLAKHNYKVKGLFGLGKDDVGYKCALELKENNIDAYCAYKDVPTASASILTDKVGNSKVIVYQGANEELNLSDLDMIRSCFDNSKAIILTYETKKELVSKALKLAKDKNIISFLNASPYIYEDEELLMQCDYLVINEEECKQIFKKDYNDIEVEELFVNNLIVTLGDKGMYYLGKDGSFKIDGIKVDAKNTTCAGDIFLAAFASSIIDGCSIYDACKIANEKASMSVTKIGINEKIK